MCNPNAILQEVLLNYSDADKWINAPFEHIKRISNTKVGDVGQDFIERICNCIGLDIEFPISDSSANPKRETPQVNKRARQSPWDIQIEGIKFELKTATEDTNSSFQFNHIRYHRTYDALLCVGISPDCIHFRTWTKAQVTTGGAGTLVTMESGANASYKLTKRPSQLWPISDFEQHILDFITDPNAKY